MTAIENKGGIKKEKEYKGEKKCIKEKEKSPSVFLFFLLSTLIVI